MQNRQTKATHAKETANRKVLKFRKAIVQKKKQPRMAKAEFP